MSSLPETPRALTERRDDGAVVELYLTPLLSAPVTAARADPLDSAVMVVPTAERDEPSVAALAARCKKFRRGSFTTMRPYDTKAIPIPKTRHDVRFSNRPAWVKRFQAIHQSGIVASMVGKSP